MYVNGISQGMHKGVKGNLSLGYSFITDGTEYFGFVPSSFCNECEECCEVGDTRLIVRYENDNPKNNGLVVKLPEGAWLNN
jgi:hypothetical protein